MSCRVFRSALPVSFWANPIIVEFVFGMIIGLARLEGYRMPNWIAALLVAAAICWFAAGDSTFWPTFREICWGLPAAAMVAAAGLCRTDMLSRNWLARSLILVGDASYALYLVHPLAALAPYKAFGWLVPPGLGSLSLRRGFICFQHRGGDRDPSHGRATDHALLATASAGRFGTKASGRAVCQARSTLISTPEPRPVRVWCRQGVRARYASSRRSCV